MRTLARWSLLAALATVPIHAHTQAQVQVQAQKGRNFLLNDVGAMVNAAVPKQVDAPEALKPLVNVELSFIKRVCRPTVRQMASIVEAGEQAYRKMSDMVQENRGAIFRADMPMFVAGNQERFNANPFTRIRADAATYLKPLVTDQQYQTYVQESKLRDEFERKAAISVAVDMLDESVLLSPQQRTELSTKLLKDWQNIDVNWMQAYLINPNYSPPIPEAMLSSILTETQMQIWATVAARKVQLSVSIDSDELRSMDEVWIK